MLCHKLLNPHNVLRMLCGSKYLRPRLVACCRYAPTCTTAPSPCSKKSQAVGIFCRSDSTGNRLLHSQVFFDKFLKQKFVDRKIFRFLTKAKCFAFFSSQYKKALTKAFLYCDSTGNRTLLPSLRRMCPNR